MKSVLKKIKAKILFSIEHKLVEHSNALSILRERSFNQEALAILGNMNVGYLPFSESSLSPIAAKIFVSDILTNRRKNVIELGAGVSTILAAATLRENNGHLVSVENSAEWIEVLKEVLQNRGLASKVSFVHAPLVSVKSGKSKCDWYDVEVLNESLAGKFFDLLLIDGPPAHSKTGTFNRYPAGDFFIPKMKEKCCIMLDDIERVGESEMAQEWGEKYKLNFNNDSCFGGLGVAFRGNYFKI